MERSPLLVGKLGGPSHPELHRGQHIMKRRPVNAQCSETSVRKVELVQFGSRQGEVGHIRTFLSFHLGRDWPHYQ